MSKEQVKAAFNRDRELRIRNVDPAIKKELRELQRILKLPFESHVIEYLVNNYRGDQAVLKQCQNRCNDLHHRLEKALKREQALRKVLTNLIVANEANSKRLDKKLRSLFKQFVGGTAKGAGGQSRNVATGSSVPKKGGGK